MKRFWAILCLTVLLICPLRASAQMGAFSGTSGRECATCHMDWLASFKKPGAILLIDPPAHSVVTEDETCLGCHDGAVADDRRGVWMEPGHRTNILPTPDIHVPDNLPLENGKISCRTCHTAHANPSNEGLTNVIFLRMPNDTGQLCSACHTAKDNGPEHGTHPLGPMHLMIPDVLLKAGARGGNDGKTVSCQSCHRPHGAQYDHLLVMDDHSNALCLSCHGELESGMSLPHVAGRHPVEHDLTQPQIKAIAAMGTLLGPKDSLACMSCHFVHKAQPGGFLLAQPLTGSQLCLSCHEDHKTVEGTPHDLRKSDPAEKNRRGQTVAQSGVCGTCHGVHTDARKTLAAPGDPAGVCMTCHAKDQLTALPPGQSALGISFAHPVDLPAKQIPAATDLRLYPGRLHAQDRTLACLTCHNPHDASHPQFLREQRDDLCANCHADKSKSLSGAHDFSTNAAARNGLGKTAQESGKCGFCHDVHRASGPALWVATSAQPASPDDLCIQCHRAGALAAKKPAFAFSHLTGPKAVPANPATVALPLFDAQAHITPSGFVSCASCHDPHVNSASSPALLRKTSNQTTSDLCLQCHADKAALRKGPHDQSAAKKPWPDQPKLSENNVCLACHQAHSNDPAKQLWTKAPAPDQAGSDGVCIACHDDRQWAAATGPLKVNNMLHPRALDKDDAASVAARKLPLADVPPPPTTQPGTLQLKPQQLIACRTCHDPHADPAALHLLRLSSGQAPQELCIRCHQDAAPLAQSPHRPDNPQMAALRDSNPSPATCSPCHAVHAVATSQRPALWAAPLSNRSTVEMDQHCLGCHGPGGSAKQPKIFVHPQAAFASLVYTVKPGEKPPQTDVAKLFSCATCHYTHGSEIPGIQKLAAQDGGPLLEAAARPMVRGGVPETLCCNCHGADAPRVFLYYHQPERRAITGFMAHPP